MAEGDLLATGCTVVLMSDGQAAQPRTVQTVVRWGARILLAVAVLYIGYKIVVIASS